MKTLDYSYNFENEYKVYGMVTDAIGIKKYSEIKTNNTFKEEFPIICIERCYGDNIYLIFRHKNNRDIVYANLAEQLKNADKSELEM